MGATLTGSSPLCSRESLHTCEVPGEELGALLSMVWRKQLKAKGVCGRVSAAERSRSQDVACSPADREFLNLALG